MVPGIGQESGTRIWPKRGDQDLAKMWDQVLAKMGGPGFGKVSGTRFRQSKWDQVLEKWGDQVLAK